MIQYLYHCDKCRQEHLIDKEMAEASRPEHCPDCKGELRRNFKSYSSMTMLNDKGWTEVDWKGRKPQTYRDSDI